MPVYPIRGSIVNTALIALLVVVDADLVRQAVDLLALLLAVWYRRPLSIRDGRRKLDLPLPRGHRRKGKTRGSSEK